MAAIANKKAKRHVDNIDRWFRSPADHVTMFIVKLFLALFTALVLIPLFFVVASSFSSATAVRAGRVILWPVNFTLDGYKAILSTNSIFVGFFNSLYYMILGTAFSVTMTMLMAYPLTRSDFQARNVVMTLVVITMFFSGGMIPTYLNIRNLGMLDTRWSLIIPGAISAYNVILCRTYIMTTIPKELYESASLDGCGSFRYFLSIVVPLSGTIIAVIALMSAVGIWNNYFNAMMYITNPDYYPLQLVLRNILILDQTISPADMNKQQEAEMFSYLVKYSTIVVGSIPMMVVYPFVQKHFVKGVMIGAIKG